MPLAELLDASFEIYRAGHPWVADHRLSPKSVARDLAERAMTFTEYVGFYGLARSEGLVLRYLAHAYQALRRTVPEDAKTDELRDLQEWLGELVRQVDSSLLDEWEKLRDPQERGRGTGPDRSPTAAGHSQFAGPSGYWCVMRCSAGWNWLPAAGGRSWVSSDAWDAGWDAESWRQAVEPYFDEHDEIGTGADARGPDLLIIDQQPGRWVVRQILDDPSGHHDWAINAEVDLTASDESGTAVLWVTTVGQL